VSVAPVLERQSRAAVDWRRVGRRTLIGVAVAVGVITLLRNVLAGSYGLDFRDGVWTAGWALLHGRSPYPPANALLLFSLQHSFVTPPTLAIVGVPFSLLPFGPAVALWNLTSVGAFIGALALLGVRDVRIYALSLSSFPVFDSLTAGQPDGLLVLAAALAWRYRDSSPGAVSIGGLIAAKLVAWPLLLWLLATRRIRSLAVACSSAVILLAGSWALIDFKGLAGYPKLLSADARAFEIRSQSFSVVSALNWLGASESSSTWLAVLVAAAVAAVVVRVGRASDHGWFTAAVIFGLLASPILWLHYLMLLFVPIAISRRHSLATWLVATYGFWILLIAFEPGGLRALVAVALASALAIWSAWGARLSPDTASSWSVGQARKPSRRVPDGM
jgi:alpha-1,2-mannosyltransferase